jgi:hypothetical protein
MGHPKQTIQLEKTLAYFAEGFVKSHLHWQNDVSQKSVVATAAV